MGLGEMGGHRTGRSVSCDWLCVQVGQHRLVGIMLLVFIRNDIYDAVRDVDVQSVGTGLLGRLVRRCCPVLSLLLSPSLILLTL